MIVNRKRKLKLTAYALYIIAALSNVVQAVTHDVVYILIPVTINFIAMGVGIYSGKIKEQDDKKQRAGR